MKRSWVLAAAALGALTAAPTAGDVGGCGRTVRELDPGAYARAKKDQDCERCAECGIVTARCASACDPKQAPEIVLPATCRPLYHDGEVCLRALDAASCDDYASFMDDVAPSVPSECDFCRVAPAPSASHGFGDGGSR